MASSSTRAAMPAAPRSPESYEALARRNAAAEILQSYEKLSWYSMQRCESLAQTRLHFRNIVAGLSADDEAAFIDWPEDLTPRPKTSEGEQSARKGKEHARSATSAAGGGDGVAGSSAGTPNPRQARERGDASGSAKKKRKS